MEALLLQAELHIHHTRPGAQRVSRPRLIERLNAGLPYRVSLVSAPAGLGKTLLC